IALPSSGGAVAGGTSTNPIRIDPTGTTTQPVSGTVTVQDGGSSISIDDGGSSITIDGSVSISGSLPSGTNNIGDVDVVSVITGTGATNLGKAVDSIAGSTDVGVALLAVRDDALSTLTPADGDYTHLRVNSQGALHVTGGGGGTEYVVNDVVPTNPTGSTFVIERDDVLSTLTEVEGDWTNPRANARGALWVELDTTNAVPITDNGGTLSIDDGGNSITVDGSVSISGSVDTELTTDDLDTGVGTDIRAVVGLVMAESGGGVLVGSSNPLPISDNGGSITIDNSTLSTTGGGTEASALRVTIANDSTGVISVDDNGGSLTVDGTVTANLSSTDNAVLDSIDTNTSFGTLLPTSTSQWKSAVINHSTLGDNTIVPAQGAGNKIAVWSILLVSDGTTDVRFEDGAGGTALTGQIPLQAREGFSISSGGFVPLFVGSANTLLNLELSAAVNVHGFISYTVVS
ncbi:MAG: hypothetical protein D6711_16440, partial [Chloroflexi bacterium]